MFGPAGSGISALSAAGAVEAADAGRAPHRAGPLNLGNGGDTLLLTVDPRSPMPQWLGVFRVPDEPVAVTADLDLLHLDPLTVSERSWSDFTGALNAAGAARHLLPVVDSIAGIDAGELTGLPGIVDFLLLRAISAAANSGRWQRVVVDLSGIGDPFALLRAPTVLAAAIDRLWPRHLRMAESAEKPALAPLAVAIDSIYRDCQDLAELLVDPTVTAAHLVLPGGERGALTAPDYLAMTELMGLPLRSVLVNAGASSRDTEAAEATVRTILGPDAGSSVSVRTVAAQDCEPTRMSALRKLDITWPAPNGRSRGASALRVDDVGGDGLDAVYELRWRQSLPDPSALALGRSGDDLLVTIAGFRQPVRLPSVLRRCQVAGADWNGRELVVTFTPDPAVWPQR
ncbi:MAG: ArsA-related P-loop ATPase [Gordonia sp. (in: high G+C Gram-positive bacteria)]|uniref:ArsA family ATPase n=1 Tax=Gordonia sp. (in: high G+C Gram-positive bacteria) TaxID=84139 RepID=UPI003BB510AB